MKGAGRHFWKTLVLSTGAGRDTPSKWTTGFSVLLVLLSFSVTKLLLPAEKALFFQWLFPGQWLILDISKDFSYVQYLCPLLGCFFSPSIELLGKCELPVSAEVMPQGHTS